MSNQYLFDSEGNKFRLYKTSTFLKFSVNTINTNIPSSSLSSLIDNQYYQIITTKNKNIATIEIPQINQFASGTVSNEWLWKYIYIGNFNGNWNQWNDGINYIKIYKK